MSKDKMSTASEKANRRFYGVPGVKYPEPEATGRRAMPGLNPETRSRPGGVHLHR